MILRNEYVAYNQIDFKLVCTQNNNLVNIFLKSPPWSEVPQFRHSVSRKCLTRTLIGKQWKFHNALSLLTLTTV